MFYTYIVTSGFQGTLYTGQTDNMEWRADEHAQGLRKGFSADHRCRHLVWFEEQGSREAAVLRERRIKAWKRDWKLSLIEEFNPHWLDIRAVWAADRAWPIEEAEWGRAEWRDFVERERLTRVKRF